MFSYRPPNTASSLSKLVALVAICLSFTVQSALAGVFPDSTFSNLNAGLVFFGKDNRYQTYVPGQANQYFDSNKKTLIYIHGWQNGATEDKKRPLFDSDTMRGAPGGLDYAAGWIDRGYNVAIFYWNQFADEGEVKDAEAKIWTKWGDKRMRWRNSRGDYSSYTGDAGNVTGILTRQYISLFANHRGGSVRIAGHSLGGQMALVAAIQIRGAWYRGEIPGVAVPSRIALLDAAFLQGGRDFLGGDWTGERARRYADMLKSDGVLIESYRSSGATSNGLIGDSNDKLNDKTAFTELKPWYFNWFQLREKHDMAKWWYLDSINYAAPDLENASSPGMNASTSSDWVRYWMESDSRLEQTEGRRTKRLTDDEFTVKDR